MGKTQATYSKALPYTVTTWPTVSPAADKDILQLLLPLLRPVGDHRRASDDKSKGARRRRKRKRAENVSMTRAEAQSEYLTVGFNSTVRSLESLARQCYPLPRDARREEAVKPIVGDLQAVFACRASMAFPGYDSLPLLIATASLARKGVEPICLVELSADSETAIANALALPRVGVLGVGRNLSDSRALLRYIRTSVGRVEVPWLQEASSSAYLPLKLQTVQEAVGSKKRKIEADNEE